MLGANPRTLNSERRDVFAFLENLGEFFALLKREPDTGALTAGILHQRFSRLLAQRVHNQEMAAE